MFWGLNLKPNRKYTQTASKSFHISQAALESESSQGGVNQIYITYENQKFLICTLRKDTCEQVMLDLNFAQGDEICFQSVGSGNVCLSGYLMIDDSMDLSDDEEEEESEAENVEDLRNALNKKAKSKKNDNDAASKALAKIKAGDDEDEDEEEDSDFNVDGLLDGEAASEEESEGNVEEEDDVEDDDDDEEDDDDDDESDEEVQLPKAKQPRLEKPQKQQNGVAKENAVAKEEKKDKKKDKKQQQQQQQQQKAGGERVITGGVKIEDVRIGTGPEAKNGKRAQVYYEGRLKSNNKVFDSHKQGAGFKFGVGRGEVIKAWDVGVAGMKVGGKRRITCPPHMAYGARGSPPTIPPNSTLVFEVELKGVN